MYLNLLQLQQNDTEPFPRQFFQEDKEICIKASVTLNSLN